MTLLLSGMRIALVIYVAAVVALYVLQDRLLLPPVENVTDIRMGHHADYDVQPWYPRVVRRIRHRTSRPRADCNVPRLSRQRRVCGEQTITCRSVRAFRVPRCPGRVSRLWQATGRSDGEGSIGRVAKRVVRRQGPIGGNDIFDWRVSGRRHGSAGYHKRRVSGRGSAARHAVGFSGKCCIGEATAVSSAMDAA